MLLSFFYFQKHDLTALVRAWKYRPSVFVDSGGFSAFTQGVRIDLDDYVRWLRRHRAVIDHFANFDEIGDARGTLRNQIRLERAGLRPLPVVHFGADPEELRRYARNGYTYQCLGGLVPHMKRCRAELKAGSGPTLAWLDRMHEAAGELGVGLHGFGVTTWPVLQRYPWRSVDSSSWASSFIFGTLSIWDHRSSRWRALKMRDRGLMQRAAMIRSYGCEPVRLIRDSGIAQSYPEAVVLAMKSWLTAARWLKQRVYLVHTLGGSEGCMLPALNSLNHPLNRSHRAH